MSGDDCCWAGEGCCGDPDSVQGRVQHIHKTVHQLRDEMQTNSVHSWFEAGYTSEKLVLWTRELQRKLLRFISVKQRGGK